MSNQGWCCLKNQLIFVSIKTQIPLKTLYKKRSSYNCGLQSLLRFKVHDLSRAICCTPIWKSFNFTKWHRNNLPYIWHCGRSGQSHAAIFRLLHNNMILKKIFFVRYVVQCIISSHQGFKVYYYTIHFAKPFNSINCFCHLLNWKLECQASLFKNGVQSNEQFPIRMFDVSCKLYKYLHMLK